MKTETNLASAPNGRKSITAANDDFGLKLTDEWSTIQSNVIENIRMMATRIRKKGEFPKMLSMTSALSGEGVSSVCVGLGVTMAHDYEADTCIVDLNWYSPSTLYPDDGDPCGVADVIYRGASLESAVRPFGIQNLHFLPAGELEPGKRPIIARSKALRQMLEAVRGRFDQIILDLPAVLINSDTVHLAANSPDCCLVIRQGVTPSHDVKMALDEINHLPILGVVLNRVNIATPDRLVKLLTE